MLPRARFKNGIECLDIDKQVNAIFPGETGDELGLMLSYAAREIVRDANIQSSVALACEYVDEELCVHRRRTQRRSIGLGLFSQNHWPCQLRWVPVLCRVTEPVLGPRGAAPGVCATASRTRKTVCASQARHVRR